MMALVLLLAGLNDGPVARMIDPGPLPLAQVRANIAARFAALDIDGNAVIDRAEAEVAAAKVRAAAASTINMRRMVSDIPGGEPDASWFDGSDADHDGKVTLAELGAAPLANFARLDSDHDGVLSVAERSAGLRREP